MSHPPLTAQVVRRLAYVRFLFEEGVTNAQRPEPLNASALLSFHDAVELFLGAATEHLGTNPDPGITFMDYWKVLSGKSLPGKAAMRSLNDARVAMKHRGTFPAAQTVDELRVAVQQFLERATPLIFACDFNTIDMIDLVPQQEVAELLKDAKTHAANGDAIHASAHVSYALDTLVARYTARDASYGWAKPPFAMGRTIGSFDRLNEREGIRGAAARREVETLEKVIGATKDLQQAVQLISLGIDLPGYMRFAATMPKVHGYFDGKRDYALTPAVEALTTEDYEWALHFTVEAALKAARADGLVDLVKERGARPPVYEESQTRLFP